MKLAILYKPSSPAPPRLGTVLRPSLDAPGRPEQTTIQPALKTRLGSFWAVNATNVKSFTVDVGEVRSTCLKRDRKIAEPLATSRCDAW